jgi:hypothetical protein
VAVPRLPPYFSFTSFISIIKIMSAIIKRPEISDVRLVLNASRQSIVATANILNGIARTMVPAAQAIYNRVTQSIDSNNTSLQSSFVLQQQAVSLEQQVRTLATENQLSTGDTDRLIAITTARLFPASNPQVLEQGIQTVMSSPNAASLQATQRQLLTSHQSAFTEHLVLAVQSAASAVKFQHVSVTNAPDGTVRAIASDGKGRTLITEIGTSIDRPPTLATEIIGVSDESCHPILDGYDRALAEAGVISSPPERKFTGGICELAAAKEFVQQPIKPVISKTKDKTSQRRAVAPKRQNQQF